MACKVILLCPISIFFILIGNGSLFLKFTVYIVKIDKNRNPLKSIAENDSSLPQCIWIVCTTPELVCGGGNKVSKHPVFKIKPDMNAWYGLKGNSIPRSMKG